MNRHDPQTVKYRYFGDIGESLEETLKTVLRLTARLRFAGRIRLFRQRQPRARKAENRIRHKRRVARGRGCEALLQSDLYN